MQSSLMMSLLRILTPEEINELTTTCEGNKRVSLTQLMYCKMGVETQGELIEASSLAKILPFTFPQSEDEARQEDLPQQEEVIEQDNELPSEQATAAPEHQEKDGKMQTSVFILHEKKRLEASVHKMRSRELLSSYRKNAALDIEQEKNLHDDMKKSSRTGVLVNKKHA